MELSQREHLCERGRAKVPFLSPVSGYYAPTPLTVQTRKHYNTFISLTASTNLKERCFFFCFWSERLEAGLEF